MKVINNQVEYLFIGQNKWDMVHLLLDCTENVFGKHVLRPCVQFELIIESLTIMAFSLLLST